MGLERLPLLVLELHLRQILKIIIKIIQPDSGKD